MPLNLSELGLNFRPISNLYGVVFLQIACLVSIPCMLEKDCNGNPISTFPPCYAFQMIFTALAPRLIQSISRNVHTLRVPAQRVCGVLLFSAGHDLTGHQTSATMSFCQFVHSPLLTMLYYTGFSNIHYMQTRPGDYKIPCKMIWKFNLYAKSLYYYYFQQIVSSCISSKYFFNE